MDLTKVNQLDVANLSSKRNSPGVPFCVKGSLKHHMKLLVTSLQKPKLKKNTKPQENSYQDGATPSNQRPDSKTKRQSRFHR